MVLKALAHCFDFAFVAPRLTARASNSVAAARALSMPSWAS